jgi:hypothetical protein
MPSPMSRLPREPDSHGRSFGVRINDLAAWAAWALSWLVVIDLIADVPTTGSVARPQSCLTPDRSIRGCNPHNPDFGAGCWKCQCHQATSRSRFVPRDWTACRVQRRCQRGQERQRRRFSSVWAVCVVEGVKRGK